MRWYSSVELCRYLDAAREHRWRWDGETLSLTLDVMMAVSHHHTKQQSAGHGQEKTNMTMTDIYGSMGARKIDRGICLELLPPYANQSKR